MSAGTKTIVVVGATGNQGSSVVRTFLSLPEWHVRAVTRNPSADKATVLASEGAELVQADLGDLASMSRAFQGAHAIFINTDFWQTFRSLAASGTPERECSQAAFDKEVTGGKNAAIAAAGVLTLERIVYSTLASIKDGNEGKYENAFHPEAKAAIVKYIEAEQPELAAKMSCIILGAYNTNALLYPRLDPRSGRYCAFTALNRDTKLPIVDPVTSTGLFVRSLIEDEEPGTKLLAYDHDSFLTVDRIMQVWSARTGKDVEFVQMTTEAMRKQLSVPLELLDGIDYLRDHGYVSKLHLVVEPQDLKNPPSTKSYEQWLKERNLDELLK